MPLQATSGAASYDGFGGGVAAVPNYIEDVFSTYLYTGNGSTQTITNGIDLSTKGGLVWAKDRDAANSNTLYDTARGVSKTLYSNTTGAQVTEATNEGVYAFGTTGFSIGGGSNTSNGSGNKIASWTFRKQPKFFDVVTYTGDGIAGRTVAHNLGSVPGCMIVKCTSTTGQWVVYHRVLGNTSRLYLNSTGGSGVDSGNWNNTDPTSTEFTLGNSSGVNASTRTYVAYIFAHDAGGFGLTGTDNVISCGSFTTDGSGNATVNLGYEPAYLNLKCATAVEGWILEDTMRGASYSATAGLFANTSGAEFSNTPIAIPTATGFVCQNGQLQVSQTYIYIAIRRGPMKVPTSGTSVFSPITYTGDGTTARDFTNFGMLPDFVMLKQRNGTEPNHVIDRLRGGGNYLVSSATQAESAYPVLSFDSMNGVNDLDSYFNASGATWVFEAFRRAPTFFDEVCYTGTGNAMTVNHNLGVTPELMIVKGRSGATGWVVYTASTGATKYMRLDNTNAAATLTAVWNDTSPTSSVFTVGSNSSVNTASATYVAYLFATCAGVSKVGSYTGTGTSPLSINCGFTGGARFVMIKRTDSTGDWYVWDTARGMVSGTDPYLLLNSTAAETNTDRCFTATGGFQVINSSPSVNAVGGTYIYLAIA